MEGISLDTSIYSHVSDQLQTAFLFHLVNTDPLLFCVLCLCKTSDPLVLVLTKIAFNDHPINTDHLVPCVWRKVYMY